MSVRIIAGACAALLLPALACAQAYAPGERIEASPLMMQSSWEACVVVAQLPGGGYSVACGPRKTEYVVQARWMRAAAPTAAAPPPPAATPARPSAPASPSTPAQPAAPATPATPAAAPAGQGASLCQPGMRVVDRQKRTGTVVEAMSGGSDCRVKLDDGSTRFYLTWMLVAAGSANAAPSGTSAGSGLETGSYDCSAGPAGTLKLVIRSASEYADRNGASGRYSYDAASAKIVFESGPWGGNYGARLGPGKIGVSSGPGAFYFATCDL